MVGLLGQLGPVPKRFPGRRLCTQSEFHSGPGPLCLALAASSTFPCSCALPLQWISLSPANILPLGFRRFRLMMQMMMKAPQVTLTGVAIALSPFLGPFPYLWPYPFFLYFSPAGPEPIVWSRAFLAAAACLFNSAAFRRSSCGTNVASVACRESSADAVLVSTLIVQPVEIESSGPA